MLATTVFAALSALNALAAAAPKHKTYTSSNELDPFYIVTTSQQTHVANSSLLADVSATSLFDPYYQTNYFLRLIGPGYGSLPTFNLTNGTLHTAAAGPHNIGNYLYNSTWVEAGSELQFAPSAQHKGNIGLYDGYLVTVGGSCEGWTVCNGDLGQVVIEWEGEDASCNKTYLQAVDQPPY